MKWGVKLLIAIFTELCLFMNASFTLTRFSIIHIPLFGRGSPHCSKIFPSVTTSALRMYCKLSDVKAKKNFDNAFPCLVTTPHSKWLAFLWQVGKQVHKRYFSQKTKALFVCTCSLQKKSLFHFRTQIWENSKYWTSLKGAFINRRFSCRLLYKP